MHDSHELTIKAMFLASILIGGFLFSVLAKVLWHVAGPSVSGQPLLQRSFFIWKMPLKRTTTSLGQSVNSWHHF